MARKNNGGAGSDVRTDDAIKVIEKYIKSKEPTVYPGVLTITPEQAGEILERWNKQNRLPRSARIRNYGDDMAESEFILNGETVKFSVKDELIDGQNRLFGSKESNESFQTFAVFGLPPKAFDTIDVGAFRTGGDMLARYGIKDPNEMAHCIRWCECILKHPGSMIMTGKRRIKPNTYVDLWFENYKGLPMAYSWGKKLAATHGFPKTRGTVLYYCFWKRGGQKAAIEFMNAWLEGNYEGRNSVIRSMHRAINRIREDRGGAIKDWELYALAIKAFNAWRDSKHLRPNDLALRRGRGIFPALD